MCMHTHACNIKTFNNVVHAYSMNAIGPEAYMQFSLSCMHVMQMLAYG